MLHVPLFWLLYIANLDHSCHHFQSFLPNHLLLLFFTNSLIVFPYCCCCGSLYLRILKVGSYHGVAVRTGCKVVSRLSACTWVTFVLLALVFLISLILFSSGCPPVPWLPWQPE